MNRYAIRCEWCNTETPNEEIPTTHGNEFCPNCGANDCLANMTTGGDE